MVFQITQLDVIFRINVFLHVHLVRIIAELIVSGQISLEIVMNIIIIAYIKCLINLGIRQSDHTFRPEI
ncbi:hypothetical protein D3C81_1975760 [compost metagenome]